MTGAALLLAAAAAMPTEGSPALVVSGTDGPRRVRVEVRVDGEAPAARHAAFLDRYFAESDRDGDGFWSAAECATLLPLPTREGAAFPRPEEFDGDRDGRVTRGDADAALARAGCAPLTLRVRPVDPAVASRHARLWRLLDRNADGALDRSEVEAAPRLLRRADLDEDEAVDAGEIETLAGEAAADAALEPAVGPAETAGPEPEVRLVLDVVTTGTEPTVGAEVVDAAGASKREVAGGEPLTIGGVRVNLAATPSADAGEAARGFFRSHFVSLGGGAEPQPLARLVDDPVLRPVAATLRASDRDGDGRVAADELDAGFGLAAAAARACVTVTVADGGRDLFAAIDRDGDGRLGLSELAGLRDRPFAATDDGAFRPGGLPASVTIEVGFGTAAGRRPAAMRAEGTDRAGGAPGARPRWFTASDRNGDGRVSRREFVGPAGRFDALDGNRDGAIDPAEAAAPPALSPSPPQQ